MQPVFVVQHFVFIYMSTSAVLHCSFYILPEEYVSITALLVRT